MTETQILKIKELNQQGKTLFSCDKYDEAIVKYKKALELDPMFLETYFNACESYIMLDKFSEAKDLINKVLLVDKTNGQAYFHLGNISLLEGHDEEGKLFYAKAILNNYDNIQIYMNLAALSEDNNDMEKAVEYYSKAIARDKLYYPAKIRRIEIYSAVNKINEALNACDDFIATVCNITDKPIRLIFDEEVGVDVNELELDTLNWFGILANDNGYRMLEALVNNKFSLTINFFK